MQCLPVIFFVYLLKVSMYFYFWIYVTCVILSHFTPFFTLTSYSYFPLLTIYCSSGRTWSLLSGARLFQLIESGDTDSRMVVCMCVCLYRVAIVKQIQCLYPQDLLLTPHCIFVLVSTKCILNRLKIYKGNLINF